MQPDNVLAGVPTTDPVQIAPDTWLIPNLFPAGEDLFVPVNSMLIRGAEPIIVDTGAPVHRELWLEKVFSLVDPKDVRWIFLSHDDGDHTGGLLDALEMCPQATLITNFFSVERLALEKPAIPLDRMRWIDEGGTLDAGDRKLRLFKPPIFDGPTTRGLFDPTTAAMWIVDTFACLTPGTLDVHEMPRDLLEENMPAMNSLVSPWHQWLDPAVYRRHVDAVEALGVLAVASAHGPVLTGDAIRESFEVVRRLAGQPNIPAPGQELLDELINQVIAA
jgi:flavorubredoxin